MHAAGLADRSLNTDEVYFPLAAREGRLTQALTDDVHPPLYPLLVAGLVAADVPEPLWRLLSVLAWLGTAWLAYLIGRRLAGDYLGLAAMALLLTSPQGAQLSRMVRSYALAALLASLTVYLYLSLWQSPTRKKAAIFAVVAGLGCYAFYYNVFLLAVLFVFSAWRLWRGGERAGLPLAATVGGGLLFSPWLLVLLAQAGEALGGGWIQWSAAPSRILRRLTQVLAHAGGIDGLEPAIRYFLPGVAGVASAASTLLLLLWGGFKCWGRSGDEPRFPGGLLLPIALGTALLALFAQYLFGSFVGVHYFVVLAAVTAPLLAAPFATARLRPAAAILFAVLLCANLVGFPYGARSGDEPLRPAAKWIDQNIGDGDLVLGVAWFAVDGYRWYGKGRPSLGIPFDLRLPGAARRAQPGVAKSDDMRALYLSLDEAEKVALLLSHTGWMGQDRGVELTTRTLRATGFTLAAEKSWPSLSAEPPVRAQIWRRSKPRPIFGPPI